MTILRSIAIPHRNPMTGHTWWIALDEGLNPSAIAPTYEGLCEQLADATERECAAAPRRNPRRNPSFEQKPMPPNLYGIPLDVLEESGNYREFWPPLVVSYGLGVDSTAVLVGMRRLGLVPSAIVFADTGAEKPETFSPATGHIANYYPNDPRDYFSIISDWLQWAEFPPITVVRLTPPISPYRTLEEQGLYTKQLPSLAMGFHLHGCSIKWKGEVIDTFIAKQWPMYQEARSQGVRPIRLIGYDDSTADTKRSRRFAAKAQRFETVWDPASRTWLRLPPPPEPAVEELDEDEVEEVLVSTPAGLVKKKKKKKPIGEWAWWYPLQTWGWDRERCKAEIAAEGLPIPNKSACFFCVAGETETVTRAGLRPIRDLAGATHRLLVPGVGKLGGLAHRGTFKEVEVKSFGVQPLWEVCLRRGHATRVVRTTAEHRWFVTAGKQWAPAATYERTTVTLKAGDHLRSLRATAPAREMFMPVAAAQGFVFGDGTHPIGREQPASVMFHDANAGKAAAMLPLFVGYEPRPYTSREGNMAQNIYGLPRFWKELPPLAESRSFLLSWLAGYFAADGTVSEAGAPSMDSAVRENLEFVRSLAAVCGVGAGRVRPKMRQGYGDEPSAMYRLSLRAVDLPEWFFRIDEHRERATAPRSARDNHWHVESVRNLGVEEEVFCAVVPDAGAFGLGEDLMTGNCPAMQPEEVDELMDRYPELAARIERLEANAEAGGKLTTVRGLWGANKMTDYMQQRREQLRSATPIDPRAAGYRGSPRKKLPTVR